MNGTTQVRYLYADRLKVVGEVDASGNLLRLYGYGLHVNSPDWLLYNDVKYVVVKDIRGSVRRVVNSQTGEVVQSLDYNDWGKIVRNDGVDFQPFAFAGGLYDSATGLTRFVARDYDGETGRWLSKDPILFEGGDTNLYGYVLQDPINFVDPEGLKVYLCSRPANIAGGLVNHEWIKTDSVEAGMMGAVGGGVPGNNADSPYVTQTKINDHTGESDKPGAQCREIPNVNEEKINRILRSGRTLGPWSPFSNNCQTFTRDIIHIGGGKK